MNRRFDFDRISLLIYALLVIGGWMTIYAVTSIGGAEEIFSLKYPHGKQLMWIGISLVAGFIVLSMDHRLIEGGAYVAYGIGVALIFLALIIGKEVNGAKSWIMIAGQQFQPSEFAKISTALALAKYMSSLNFSLSNTRHLIGALAIIFVPALIVVLQNDTGSALVFASLLIVFYREGLNPILPAIAIVLGTVIILSLGIKNRWIVWGILFGATAISFLYFRTKRNQVRLGLIHLGAFLLLVGVSFSAQYLVSKLQPHQKIRIEVLFNPEIDPQGAGYNVTQSKIAIGSGGFAGKGFLQGSYTKYKFVPKQETDFIFCTVGEEYGWLGSAGLVALFFALIWRLRFLAEYAKTRFARIYGYGIISILFFHVMVNIGMTLGLVPVIGIPLPFFSYGGSSLLAFTLMIFLLLNLFSFRSSVLGMKT